MPEDLIIPSLQGGLNDTLPPHALAQDQCVTAENVEWFRSTLGERRAGCEALSITDSDLEDETVVVHLSQWFPANNITVPEFWAVSATPNTSVTIAKRTAGTWSEVVPMDAINTSAPDVYNIVAQAGPASVSPNGKLFFAYRSAVDRLHVWDPNNGPTLRRTGLAQPALGPTVANVGVGAFAANTRYYRVRFVRQAGVGSQNSVRSEPSVSTAFTPSGAGAGARVTRPAAVGEGETAWELEASFDNILFYNIQSTTLATLFFDDVFLDPISYSAEGVLSEDIGTYLLQHSAKFLAVDGDRLLMAGHWTDLSLQSTIWWTPVYADPGVGNDERLPLDVNNSRSLDNYAGGPITGISSAIYGSWYAFKWSRIYKLARTGDVTNAYSVLTLSTTRGAIPGSIFQGMDENGAACIYFLDPLNGPSRIGPGGVQIIVGLRKTWKRVNLAATGIVARGCYYPYKQQAIWVVSTDGANTPDFGIKLQISVVRPQEDGGVGRGWSTFTGRIAEAYCMTTFSEVITEDGNLTLRQRPFIGLTSPDYIQRCDVGATDAGVAYTATIRSRPYIMAGLLNKWGAMTAALLATATAVGNVVINFVRDFGLESNGVTTDLAATSTEDPVIKPLDNIVMSNAIAIQVEFTDPAENIAQWELQRLDIKPRTEQRS